MSEVTYGVSGSWDLSDQMRPVSQPDFSVPSAVGLAPNKASGVEHQKCYTVSTADTDLKERFGEGDVLDQIRAIGRGVPDGQTGINVTVVTVPESESADPETERSENIAAIAGLDDQRTGVYALKSAVSHGALLPRLLTAAGNYDAYVSGAANPIATAMLAVAASTFGFACINGTNSTETAALAARALYTDKRGHMVETGAKVYDDTGQLVTRGASGFWAGLQAAVDMEHGGIPSHVAGNRGLRIAAPGREIDFDWYDPSTEGQRLLAGDLGIIVRGAVNDDFAAGDGGMIYVGAATFSSEPLETFYNVVRMQDFILLGLLRTYKLFLLKYNMSPSVLEAVAKTAQAWLSGLAQREVIYKAPKVQFIKNPNTPNDWRTGKLVMDGYAEPRSPLARIDQTLHRTTTGIEIEIADLESFAQNLNL